MANRRDLSIFVSLYLVTIIFGTYAVQASYHDHPIFLETSMGSKLSAKRAEKLWIQSPLSSFHDQDIFEGCEVGTMVFPIFPFVLVGGNGYSCGSRHGYSQAALWLWLGFTIISFELPNGVA